MKISITAITLLLVSIFFLAACAPAQAPIGEAPVTTQVRAIIEPSATPQTRATISFYYEYTTDIPRPFFNGTDVDYEIITFEKSGGAWTTADLKPQIADFGPLFRLEIHVYLHNINGSCGINTLESENITTKVSVQPVCNTIGSEESAGLTFGIESCDRNSFGALICRQDTDSGSLRYALNKEMDKFQFIVDGPTTTFMKSGSVSPSKNLVLPAHPKITLTRSHQDKTM